MVEFRSVIELCLTGLKIVRLRRWLGELCVGDAYLIASEWMAEGQLQFPDVIGVRGRRINSESKKVSEVSLLVVHVTGYGKTGLCTAPASLRFSSCLCPSELEVFRPFLNFFPFLVSIISLDLSVFCLP